MNKRINMKRFTSLLLAVLMLLSALQEPLQILAGEPWYSNQTFNAHNTGATDVIISIGGGGDTSNWAPTEVSWKNPLTSENYHAYCVNPAWKGVEPGDSYAFDIMNFDDSTYVDEGGSNQTPTNASGTSQAGNNMGDALTGAVVYGYPSRTAEEVLKHDANYYGVTQEQLDYAAYTATKFAIWALVHRTYSVDKWLTYSGSSYPAGLRTATLEAMKEIYAFASTYVPPSGTTIAVNVGASTENGGNLEFPCTVSGGITMDADYYIRAKNYDSGGTFPAGLQIASTSGTVYAKQTGTNGEERFIIPAGTTTFKVILPKPSGETYSIQEQLELYAPNGTPVLAYAAAKVDARQNYILAGVGYDNVPFEINDNANPDPMPTPTPGTPSNGKLKVIKLDAKDNMTPLQGVTFDLYNSSGQLIDTGTTGANGEWIPNVTEAGTYTVVERSTNTSYQLTEPTTLVITIEADKEATATFRDFKKQTVTVYKEDAITGEPIPGVQYELSQIDGKGAWRTVGQTDSQGRIVFEDVPDGTYKIFEVSTVSSYILDPSPQFVTVRNGQAPSIKFLNSKFPGLSITKIDRQTGEIIKNPATFRVEQIDGDYTIDVTTENGIATIKDMPVGSFKIQEKSSPEGYVIDENCGYISLNEGESKQYIAYNLKAPVLTIEKIDGQTLKGIPGTRFQLKYTDGTIIGTVETGQDGKAIVGMKGGELGYLRPGVITVTEMFVPEPYVNTGEHQDILLSAGDSKSLLFANLEMPEIVVEKYVRP